MGASRGPNAVGRQPDRRRDGGDPVETVEHGEDRQPGVVGQHVGQKEERQAAEAVVREQEPAAVESVGEPARGGGADEVEDPHRRQHARRLHLEDAVVHARGDEVGADEAVGAGAAHEERPGEEPEVAHGHGAPQRVHGDARRIGGRRRRGGGVVRGGAEGEEAEVRGGLAHPAERDGHHEERGPGDEPQRRAPARTFDDAREDGQEQQLSRRGRGGERAEDQAAPAVEPAGDDDRTEDVGRHPGRGADEEPPQDDELPRPSDRRGEADRDRERPHGEGHGPAHAEALGDRGAERADQAIEQEVDRDGDRDRRARPAELALERDHEDPGGGADGRADEQDDERGGGDVPGVMKARAHGAEGSLTSSERRGFPIFDDGRRGELAAAGPEVDGEDPLHGGIIPAPGLGQRTTTGPR